MKKIVSALVLIGFLAVLLVPVVASAVDVKAPESCTMKRTITLTDITCTKGSAISLEDTSAVCCLMNTLYNVTDWMFVIMVGLAGIFVIIGALTLLMGAGAPDKLSSGRSYIMWAAIGLAIGLLAKAIPNLVRMIAGM